MSVQEKLAKYNQQHILQFKNQISKSQLNSLNEQILSLNFDVINNLNAVDEKQELNLQPLNTLSLSQIQKHKQEYSQIGQLALKQGKVGVVLLAGGMGTRLGSDLPKGMYNIGETKNLYIFECIFNSLKIAMQNAGTPIHMFIMTSPSNDQITREFLREHNYFGYSANHVSFFVQEVNPCVDFNGKILLENKHTIATSPNGNGGWFASLLGDSTCLNVLQNSNIEWLNLISVDNVLTSIATPAFVGACILGNHDVGIKVIKKACAEEKVGLLCLKNNRPSIVEYIDLPHELAIKKDANGNLLLAYGAIINFLYNIKFLYNVKSKKLPIHVVAKKIPHINQNGQKVEPNEPNGYKFEYLNVDLVEFASSCLPYEIDRNKEFAPVKNRTGVDSVETAKQLLKQNGIVL